MNHFHLIPKDIYELEEPNLNDDDFTNYADPDETSLIAN